MITLVLLASMTIAPDDCVSDYLIAVNGNAMGWFCGRWDCGNREFEAKTSMDLYRAVAGDVLAGNVYDLRPFGASETILIRGERKAVESEIVAILRAKYPNPDANISVTGRLKHVGTRQGYQEYQWITSHTEQGLIKSLVEKFKDVKPGALRR